jgi:hypothetical protein
MFHHTNDVLLNVRIIIYNVSNALNTTESYLAVEDYQKKMFPEINYLETATTQQVYAKESLDP